MTEPRREHGKAEALLVSAIRKVHLEAVDEESGGGSEHSMCDRGTRVTEELEAVTCELCRRIIATWFDGDSMWEGVTSAWLEHDASLGNLWAAARLPLAQWRGIKTGGSYRLVRVAERVSR